jgi:ABC-type nitrate/sulfonate/bicarbonate transport system substrate-binding protein
VIGAAAGCGSSDDSSASTSSATASAGASTTAGTETQKANLLLPFPLNVNYVSGVMAADKYFGQQGLDVDFQSVDGSPVLVQQMVAGKADFGVSGTSAVLTANAKGADLRAIAVARHDASAVLSVPEDSPIKSVADLKGKNVGIPSLSDGSVAVVTAALSDAGLKVGDDVHLVVVGQGGPAVASALKSGRIAAYSAGVSDQPGLEVGGDIKLRSIMPPKYAGLPDTVFVTTQKVLDDPQQREVAIKMAKALIEGAAAAKADPAAAVKAGCEMFPEQCKTPGFAEVAVKDGNFSDNPVPGTKPAYMDPAKMKVYVDALKASGQIPEDVDVESTFPNTYVEQITGGDSQ